MENNFTIIKVLLAFFFLQNVSAQVANDFEFIDHRARNSDHLESKILDDRFLYVANHNAWPMTTVTEINTNTNEIDTIMGTFYGWTDMTEFSDGTFDIYIHSMFDYDVCVSGFFHIAHDGSEYKIDTLHSYILPGGPSDHYPISVSKGNNNDYYMLDYQSLYHSDGVNVTEVATSNTFRNLFQNDNRDVFMYSDSDIVKVSDLSLDTIQSMSKKIIEIKNQGIYNDILLEGEVQRWNDDFSQLLQSWPIEGEYRSFYEVHVGSSLVTTVVSDQNQFKYQSFTEAGDESIINSGENEHEVVKGFHFMNETNLVSIIDYQIEEINSNQLVFRNTDFVNEINYESREVSIDSVSLMLVNLDTINSWVNTQTGDTMYFVRKDFEMNLDYTNHSDVSIEQYNFQTNDVFANFYFPSPNLNFSIKEEVLPGASNNYPQAFDFVYDFPTVVTFAIPGADFRINNDANRILTTDVVLPVKNLVLDVDLVVFPNPTEDQLNIEVGEEIEEIAIYNVQGQLMMYKALSANLDRLDVSTLQTGSYFIKLRLKGQEGFAVQQFVKM